MHPLPFEVVSGLEQTSHGALSIALAAEFDEVDVDATAVALGDIADILSMVATAPFEHQLALVGDILAGELRTTRSRSPATIDDLLFHRVVDRGVGQAAVCAVVAVEAARLAGIELGIVASRSGVYVAHRRAGAPLLLVPDRGWLPLDAHDLDDPDLAWHCPHETAGLVLGMILARGQRSGLLSVQLRAAELCLALPVADDERSRLRMQLARVRASLN